MALKLAPFGADARFARGERNAVLGFPFLEISDFVALGGCRDFSPCSFAGLACKRSNIMVGPVRGRRSLFIYFNTQTGAKPLSATLAAVALKLAPCGADAHFVRGERNALLGYSLSRNLRFRSFRGL